MVVNKNDIDATYSRFSHWWEHKGLVVSSAVPLNASTIEREHMVDEKKYHDPEEGAQWLLQKLGDQVFPGDNLPFIDTDIGPGSLALFLGCQPKTHGESVWFHSPYTGRSEIPDLSVWDDENFWWLRTQQLFKRIQASAGEQVFLPFPDLCENIDVLASLRGAESLMFDCIDDPAWVMEKVNQIGDLYETAISKFLPLVQRSDGSTSFHAFRLWGEGITAKIQCDASAMISRDMFDTFVLPSLNRQCEFLDNSLYHLDGTQSIQHLDSLLGIPGLNAVEWTPQAGIESGEHPRWYPMYRRILDAGKSLQILVEDLEHVPRLLQEIGTDGVYLFTILSYDDFMRLLDIVETYA